jgi:hypothetical protein
MHFPEEMTDGRITWFDAAQWCTHFVSGLDGGEGGGQTAVEDEVYHDSTISNCQWKCN